MHVGIDIAQFILNFSTFWKRIISFTYWPPYPHTKNFPHALTEGWVGQDISEYTNIFCLCWDSNTDTSVVQPVT